MAACRRLGNAKMTGINDWQRSYNDRLMGGGTLDANSRLIDLERADARRKALEDVLRRIEGLGGNYMYQKAFKVVIASIRAMIVNPRVTGGQN